MKINYAGEYLEALAKREHFLTVLADGANRFSGYGLELFERGVKATIDRLNSSIKEYEAEAGGLIESWVGITRNESVEVSTYLMPLTSSLGDWTRLGTGSVIVKAFAAYTSCTLEAASGVIEETDDTTLRSSLCRIPPHTRVDEFARVA